MAEAGCKHFFHVKPSKIRTDLSKRASLTTCSTCRTQTPDPWFCLNCSEVQCGRVGNSHMQTHYANTHHPLVISPLTAQIWCYECDEDFDLQLAMITVEKNKDKAEEVANVVRGFLANRMKKTKGREDIPQVIKPPLLQSKPEESKPVAQPRGLSNLGNTCFFNSSLQCLNATAPLVSRSADIGRFGPVNAAFSRVIEALKAKGAVVNPKDLHTAVVSKHRQFRGFGQHDSHEMLRCMLDSMSMEQSKAKMAPTLIEQVFGGRLLSSVLCAGCVRVSRDQTMSRSLDPILDISLEMSKKSSSRRPDTLSDLASSWRLELRPSDFSDGKGELGAAVEPGFEEESESSASLAGCLAAFTKCEALVDRDNLYDCPRCREKCPALRRLLIFDTPKILVLHIKRFSSHGRTPTKLTTFVGYPQQLDISQYCVSHQGRRVPKYNLYAVSVHSGGMQGGHYVAYVKHRDAWFHCSDSHVSRVSEQDVMRLQAYVLFYQAEEDSEGSTQDDEPPQQELSAKPIARKPSTRYLEEQIDDEFQ